MGEDVGRATTDNQHKYPTTPSEGNVAADVGLPAEGLINDSSVVWRWFYSQSSSPPAPSPTPCSSERLKSKLLFYRFPHYKQETYLQE